MTRKKKQILIAAAIVLLLCVGVSVFVLLLKNHSAAPVQDGFTLDANAHDYTPSVELPSSEKEGIAIPGYSTVYFPEGETTVPLTLYNPEKNACLFRFELYLEDQEEMIASTGLIEPGKAVQEITLARALPAGNYTLNIKVDTYTADTQMPLNNALVKAALCVLPA